MSEMIDAMSEMIAPASSLAGDKASVEGSVKPCTFARCTCSHRKVAVLGCHLGGVSKLALDKCDVKRARAHVHVALAGITRINVRNELRQLAGRRWVAFPVACRATM